MILGIARLFSVAVIAVLAFSGAALPQQYPARPIKLVSPYPPGGPVDTFGRLVSARAAESLGQPIVFENRPGATGLIAGEHVAKSAPDGHTLLVAVNGPVAVNKFLYQQMPYDPDKDLVPISLLASSPQMLVVSPAVGVDSFKMFVEYVRLNPGRLSYASVGSGSASHLTMELLKSDARLFIVHIPYRGFPPAVTDMLAGNVQAMFAIIPAVLPQVKAGKMKGLAVTGLKRSPLAADVPSVAELGYPQLESLAWIGLLAPASTPPAVLSRLNAEAVRAMHSQDTQDSLARQGFDVVAGPAAEFAKWIQAESVKWSGVIRASGAAAD